MWRLELYSNPRPFERKATNLPMSHHAPHIPHSTFFLSLSLHNQNLRLSFGPTCIYKYNMKPFTLLRAFSSFTPALHHIGIPPITLLPPGLPSLFICLASFLCRDSFLPTLVALSNNWFSAYIISLIPLGILPGQSLGRWTVLLNTNVFGFTDDRQHLYMIPRGPLMVSVESKAGSQT